MGSLEFRVWGFMGLALGVFYALEFGGLEFWGWGLRGLEFGGSEVGFRVYGSRL